MPVKEYKKKKVFTWWWNIMKLGDRWVFLGREIQSFVHDWEGHFLECFIAWEWPKPVKGAPDTVTTCLSSRKLKTSSSPKWCICYFRGLHMGEDIPVLGSDRLLTSSIVFSRLSFSFFHSYFQAFVHGCHNKLSWEGLRSSEKVTLLTYLLNK